MCSDGAQPVSDSGGTSYLVASVAPRRSRRRSSPRLAARFQRACENPNVWTGGPRHRRPAPVSTLCHIAADGIRPPVGPDRAVHQAEFFALVQERHTWQAEEHGRQRECPLPAEVVGAEPGGGPVLVEARSHPPD